MSHFKWNPALRYDIAEEQPGIAKVTYDDGEPSEIHHLGELLEMIGTAYEDGDKLKVTLRARKSGS